MTNRDRIIHAPEFRTGMNRHTDKPLCWRAEDDGTACVAAATPDLHEQLMETTPGCAFCKAGQRAAWLYWTYARC
jgi:hypothetical protein